MSIIKFYDVHLEQLQICLPKMYILIYLVYYGSVIKRDF
jgi:hypothetical protein